MASDEKYTPFSIRSGRRIIPTLGLQDMPAELRISLWNVIEPWIWSTKNSSEFDRRAQWIYNFHCIRWPTNEIPDELNSYVATDRLHEWFVHHASCDDIFDVVEALPRMIEYGLHANYGDYQEVMNRSRQVYDYMTGTIDSYLVAANEMLAREGAPYRIIDGVLTLVTNETEIAEVSKAMSVTDTFAVAADHIAEGAKHLGTRPPSYADCIKQSISAIESTLKIAVGSKSSRMTPLLEEFERKHGKLHPSLRSAISKLYGYASDEEGVRHGANDAISVGEPEARVMLVMCSALMNFLIRKTSA